MRAGRLTYRLDAWAPATEETASGATRTAYAPAGWMRAERVSLSGRYGKENGELFDDARSVWRVRDAHPAERGWRLREAGGGDLWEVVRVEPSKRLGMLTLHCERVNE